MDKLYKLHYVFNVHYAVQLKMFFLFLESVVYGMSSIQQMPNKVMELSAAIDA